jgi:streptogramin lyase
VPQVTGQINTRLRRLGLGLTSALLAALAVSNQAAAGSIGYQNFNEWDTTPMVTGSATPFGIVTGPDGNMWWTAPQAGAIVKVSSAGTLLNTYYAGTGCHPAGITVGPDKNLWVACFYSDVILQVKVDGTITQFPLPVTAASRAAGGHQPAFLTSGPDGYLWFTESNLGYISKLNVATGSLWEYPIPSGAASVPRAIAVGQDGNVWFTEYGGNKIGQVTTSGSFTQYSVPTAGSGPLGLAVARDGNLYFAEDFGNKIGRISPSGSISEYPLTQAAARPQYVAIGPDGNLWFSERATSQLQSLNIDAATSNPFGPGPFGPQASPPTPGSVPGPLADGPDGNIWFSETGANKIARMGTRYIPLALDRTAVGFGNVRAGTTTAPQRVTVNDYGSAPMRWMSFAFFQPSYASGMFTIVTSSCQNPPFDTTNQFSCSVDLAFTATATAGATSGTLSIRVQALYTLPYVSYEEQELKIDLSATTIGSNCATTSIATDLASPQTAGATVTATATAAGCPDASPLYRFYLRSPEGTWTDKQDFSTNASFIWNTTGYESGTYLLGVWLKDANSTSSYDTYAQATFTLTSSACSSTSLVSDVASPQAPGPTVNFTAASSGCSAPLYQWWVRDINGIWKVAPGFDFTHSSTAFAWSTSGLPAGTYQVGVWAKQTGSTASYDAFAFTTFTLTPAAPGPGCQSAGVTATPASPANAGASAVLQAASTGCSSAQYRWWVRDTAGQWVMVQDYPAGAGGGAFTWSTAGLPGGTYLLGVWARQAGSATSYEAYSFITYTLTVSGCAATSITPAPASPQTPGTSITLTANASGCSTPQFRFWAAPPGGSFTESRPYMSGNSLTWDSTGLQPGVYQVGVWARQTGSLAAYEAYAIATFQVKAADVASPCTTLELWPSMTLGGNNSDQSQTPQPSASTLIWTAFANCTADFAFFIETPWSTPQLLQPFSSSNVFTWNAAGLPAGNYKILVLVRSQGATSYDLFATSEYELV